MFKGVEVSGFVIGNAVAPADEHDALPFEGQSAHGGRMLFTLGDLLLDEELGPGAVLRRTGWRIRRSSDGLVRSGGRSASSGLFR